jgi:hypothetical protein
VPNSHEPRDFWSKLDIVGKLLSSIVLAAIALLIKAGADNVRTGSEQVANALKRGQLVQSLVADLATKQDKTRQDLALIALDRTATTKEDDDLVDDIAEEVLLNEQPAPTDYFGDTAMKIIERRDKARAARLHEEQKTAISSTRADASANANDGSSKEEQTNGMTKEDKAKAVPFEQRVAAAVLHKLVSIEYRGQENAPLAAELKSLLDQSGLPGPEPEEVDADFPNQVRYFNAQDRPLALQTAKIVDGFVRTQANGRYKDYSISVHYFIYLDPKPPLGQVEVWCNLDRQGTHGTW